MWTVCPTELSSESVVYSFGVGDNLAWECALIERFGLQVLAFDPTPARLMFAVTDDCPGTSVPVSGGDVTLVAGSKAVTV